MSKRRSIVFGSNGYLGLHLGSLLEQDDHEVYCFDIHDNPSRECAYYRPLNLLDRSALDTLDHGIDEIYMLAGLNGTHRGFSEYDSFFQVNVVALVNILDWMARRGSSARIIFPSSRLVYRGKDSPLREADELDPLTIYAVNKVTAENLLKAYHRRFGINYTVFRISLPYGDMFGKGFFKGNMGAFLNKARNGEDIIVYGNGENRRSFIHIEDLCHLLIKASEHADTLNDTFNVGGEDLSLMELALMFARRFGVEVKTTSWPREDKLIETGSTVLDDSKLRDILELEFKHSLKPIISNLQGL